MNKSEQINELATALSLAQGEMENAAKSSENPHFRSRYADLAEVINCIRPVFAKHGLAFTQVVSYDSGIVSVETVLMHKGGQWLSGTISAPVSKQDAQGVGSATTYCRRYSLAAVAGLAQEDDDANAAVGHGAKQQAKSADKPAPVTSSDREAVNNNIRNLLHRAGCKDSQQAGDMVAELTTFKGKDGNMVAGKRDYKALSDKAAEILVKTLEKIVSAPQEREVCHNCGADLVGGECAACGPF